MRSIREARGKSSLAASTALSTSYTLARRAALFARLDGEGCGPVAKREVGSGSTRGGLMTGEIGGVKVRRSMSGAMPLCDVGVGGVGRSTNLSEGVLLK